MLPLWLLIGLLLPARAHTAASDSLRRALEQTPTDSSQVLLLLKLGYSYRASQPDSTVRLAQRALVLARQVALAPAKAGP